MKSVLHINWHPLTSAKQYYRFTLAIFALFLLISITGCNKEEEPDFAAAFSYEMVNDNYVMFTNQSTGEYYSLEWDFGNGVSEITADKKSPIFYYYPEAGDFNVTVTALNYVGSKKSDSKNVNIASNDLLLSFSANPVANNPNYIDLVNTTEGTYDSFKWVYLDVEVENEMEHQAYFPLAGTYDIELVVTKFDVDVSTIQTVNISQDDPANLPNLVWSDEFSYTGLPDPEKWNMETGGNGFGNNELQYYTDSENNAMVDNGVLTITAREESFGGRDYTSARINTQDKFDFTYGRVEARIKLPYGQGLWPAFWLLGSNVNSVSWPACGEIDIVELVGGTVSGGDNTCHSTLHWDDNGHAEYGESYTLDYGKFADDFHVFSVEWDSATIRSYVDGIEYYIVDITPAGLSEFHNNFFILLNVAVGGNWPGPPNAETIFPQTMEIDYVRVFQEEVEE